MTCPTLGEVMAKGSEDISQYPGQVVAIDLQNTSGQAQEFCAGQALCRPGYYYEPAKPGFATVALLATGTGPMAAGEFRFLLFAIVGGPEQYHAEKVSHVGVTLEQVMADLAALAPPLLGVLPPPPPDKPPCVIRMRRRRGALLE